MDRRIFLHRIRAHVPHMITYSVHNIHTSFRLIVHDEKKRKKMFENFADDVTAVDKSAQGAWAQ
jgi:hypothetical protein